MKLELSPFAGQDRLADPDLAGEWAPAMEEIDWSAQVPPWCSYVARREGVAVGSGGFKGPPDGDGWVEAAYISFIPYRGQGVASAIAAELVQIARAHGANGVCAHTLAERNASVRVLESNGFRFAGDVIDPEDGPIWRWELRLK